jgi:RNase adaptor protein for sRNA GlmZ degradation
MVKQFLERETRMPDFMNHVFALVSINVEDYVARGFEQLSVSFGCTGGQHRSVYAANQLANFLRTRYNLNVAVTHCNEKKWLLHEENTEA